MKILSVISILLLSGWYNPLLANEFSLGVATISPNGLSAKYWNNDNTAFDVFAEWNFNSDSLNTHADYLTHTSNRVQLFGYPWISYYGFGIRVEIEEDEDTEVGVRIPFGVTAFPDFAPVDLFGEVAPRMDVVPDTNFGLDVMIGIRYRFAPQDHRI